MARHAILIDAGYVMAWGAERRVGGRAPRSAAACNYAALVTALTSACHAVVPGEDLLRIYWYDGAPQTGPTADHLAIGALDDVKVRLGRLKGYEQKGVDTLIVLDLTTLARERSISTAFLISGDEDIREGVVVAQQLGIRLVLGCLQPRPGTGNQAQTLMSEADRLLDLTASTEPHFSHVPTPPFQAGQVIAQNWLGTPNGQQLSAQLTAQKQRQNFAIPGPTDAHLLTQGLLALSPPPPRRPLRELEDWHKRELRRGFWDGIP